MTAQAEARKAGACSVHGNRQENLMVPLQCHIGLVHAGGNAARQRLDWIPAGRGNQNQVPQVR
jgi:hypothetical protein